ncbi:MAG TPA: hypothetical protein VN626_06980 [Clostridia bacterium]|nr:hypothetical protein [Clostridia bacterium]
MKMFFGGTVIAVLLRILLKTLYIDTDTGFYLGGGGLIYGFAAVVLLTVLAVTVSTLRADGTDSADAAILRGNRPLELSAAVLGVTIAATSVPKLMAALAIDPAEPVINRLPGWLLIIENIFGLAAGAAFLYLAFCFYSGFQRSGLQGMLALPMVIWQAISMVERYISFRQVNTVSDQFLETMYLVFATLFLLANTRCMAGIPKSRKVCVLWGLLTAHFGLVLTAGQLAATMVLGGDISGPPVLQMLIISALTLYAFVVSFSLMQASCE